MTDINWHTDMENCPNDVAILLGYDDGTFTLTEAEDNDTEWSKHYPRKGSVRGVSSPIKWAAVQ